MGPRTWSRPVLPALVLLLVVAANSVGLLAVEETTSAFGCLWPFGTQQPCVTSVRPADGAADPILDPAEGSVMVGGRTDPYVQLRRRAPQTTYLVSVAAPHIWAASPLLLISTAGAADVVVLQPELGRAAAASFDPIPEALPEGSGPVDIAVGRLRFRLRLADGPVEEIVVFHTGRDIVFLDARLISGELQSLASAR
jgi:hypothetical protein